MSARTRPAEATRTATTGTRATRAADGGGGAGARRLARPGPWITAAAVCVVVGAAVAAAALGVIGPDQGGEGAAGGAGAGLGGAAQGAEGAEVDRLIDFDRLNFGVPPDEFWYDASGPHGPALVRGRPLWRTYTDTFAPSPRLVLLQASALRQLDHFPIAVVKGFQASDLTLTARVKVLGGEVDQAAGLVWRVRDKDNYYGALASASDRRLRLFRMVGGRGSLVASAPIDMANQHEHGAPLPGRGWYTLRVDADRDRIVVRFRGRVVLDARDTAFPGPGAAGLVTHADAISAFDDVQLQTGRSRGKPIVRALARPAAPPVLHVEEVVVTDAAFRAPAGRTDLDGKVFFKIRVAGADGRPVAGAMIDAAVVGPDGGTVVTAHAMTGTDGYGLFTVRLARTAPAGSCRVVVRALTHADRPDARHDRAADQTAGGTFVHGGG